MSRWNGTSLACRTAWKPRIRGGEKATAGSRKIETKNQDGAREEAQWQAERSKIWKNQEQWEAEKSKIQNKQEQWEAEKSRIYKKGTVVGRKIEDLKKKAERKIEKSRS